jgi:uncharacterized membrane protein YkvA (DUF1232 family)
MPPKRNIVAAVLVGIGAIVYGVSPIDFIPDVLFPVGYADDAALWVTAALGIWKLLSGRKSSGPDAAPPVA